MAVLHDYTDALKAADDARDYLNAYGERAETNRYDPVALAVLLGTRAICAELRALGVLLDYLHGLGLPS